ncbi:zinc finger protein 431-like isoform X1 [Topomyia yanbarensis]|uniref:zinc finger protein 431-like isoform X1 n=1 Tax=Topomyia yanbarensis TaxID=2498891 RepID=UPI00273CF32F|nr:zinc finger protein 431-like isoform X1 [Topomyia yanbarensis]
MTELSTRLLMPGSCRCCLLEEGEMFCILDTMDEFESTICDLIKDCIGITIMENDSFSRSICNACFNDLSTAVRFRQRCLKTEDILLNTQIDIGKSEMKELTDESRKSPQKITLEENEHKNSETGSSSQQKSTTIDIGHDKLADRPAVKLRRPRTGGPHKCDICGKVFTRASYLDKHYRIHTGERPYKCSICPRAFATSANFRNHERLHTNNRPHKCDLCDKRFISNSHLKEHKRAHTGERPYPCDICGKEYSSNSHLMYHRAIHTGDRIFECDFCDKKFVLRSKLNTHMVTHTNEKRFQCDVCGKKFKHKDYLKSHVRIHAGPQKCDICGEEFLKFTPFELHRKLHKEEAPQKT